MSRRIVFAILLAVAATAVVPYAVPAVPLATGGAGALVLVNSLSDSYADFQHVLKPCLDRLGVPYALRDMATSTVGDDIGLYAVIIIGHRRLDPDGLRLDSAQGESIAAAVRAGTGLVNFDNDLSGDGSTPRYEFVDRVFGFGYGEATTGHDVHFSAPRAHYITERFALGESVPTGPMRLAGIALGRGATALATSGTQPVLAVTRYGDGRAVQWGSYDLLSPPVAEPFLDPDGLVRRSIDWAAREPLAAVISMPDDAQGGTGTDVQVPISLTGGAGASGIDMTVTYDPAVLEIVPGPNPPQSDKVTVSGIAAAAGFSIVANAISPGTLIIAEFATGASLSGSGEIARIQFHVIGNPGATSSLAFARVSVDEGTIPASPDNGLFTVTCAGAPDGTVCNDGNSCTLADTCQAGACVGGTTIVIPGEVTNLGFSSDHSTLSWDSASAAGAGTVHDVARGLVRQLPVGGGAAESCLAPGVSAATASDPSSPQAGDSYWYLVRGRNACGTGTYGFAEVHGVPTSERTTGACP